MQAKIKKQHVAQFNPTFNTVINGKPAKVTLKQAEENAEIYAFTPIGVLYEDSEQVRADVKKRQKVVSPKKVDMSKVRRGSAFDPNSSNKKATSEAIASFKEKQELNLFKIAKRKGKQVQEPKAGKAMGLDKETAKAKKAKELKDTK